MGVLGEVRGDKLRDVVPTIQAEQNVVIRHKPERALIVQGVVSPARRRSLHRIATCSTPTATRSRQAR